MRLAAFLLLAAFAAPSQQYRAFWADAFHAGYKSEAEVEKLVADAVESRANAIFVQVRRRADSYYLQTLEVPAQDAAYNPNFDALRFLIERAHARGIEVHAWSVVYPAWPSALAPPANPAHVWHKHGPRAQGDDMWQSVSETGGVSSAFDPGHPAVQRYLADVIVDPVSKYDLDGIHLDYIRYIEDAPYGYNPKALERFARLENRVARPARNDAAFSDFRRRQVTQLVRQIYLRAIAVRPSVKVSAALISWGNGPLSDAGWRSTDAYATVFQDWRAWLEEGILDIAMPMHYFRESANAAFLDRWLAFAKDRQYGRRYLPGLAPYLNPIPDTLGQLRRALAPGPGGGEPLGVCFYSYASTNTLNAAGDPITPNSEFYRAVGEFFGAPATVPALPWKVAPTTGHLMGRLEVDDGPDWLYDGVEVLVESDTGAATSRTGTTDGTGFFGFVDLPPDRYRLRLERGGALLHRAVPVEVRVGAVARADVRLAQVDFAAVLPRLGPVDGAAPGDVVTLRGVNLARAEAAAQSVPLPTVLGSTQVLVNGEAAPMFSASGGELVVQLPYRAVDAWDVLVRNVGMQSQRIAVPVVPARPVIVATNRAGRYLEIYATGLGAVSPPIGAGLGADPSAVLPQVVLPVRVLFGDQARDALYAGLAPFHPGRYQVNVEVPEAASATVRIIVGEALSAEFRY